MTFGVLLHSRPQFLLILSSHFTVLCFTLSLSVSAHQELVEDDEVDFKVKKEKSEKSKTKKLNVDLPEPVSEQEAFLQR